jgi:hypothetical protein
MAKAKQLYHSELASIGQWVQIKIDTDVLQSKFKAEQRYCNFYLNGELRSYVCENAACETALRGRRGQTIQIFAAGSREEATIQIDPQAPAAAATPPPQQRSATPPPAPSAPPPAAPPQHAPPPAQHAPPPPAASPAKVQKGRVWSRLIQYANLFQMCDLAAQKSYGDMLMPEMTPEEQQMMSQRATTLFIQGVREGLADLLPADKFMAPKPAGAPQTASPPAAAAPPPPPPAPGPQPPAHPEPAEPPEDDVPF